VKKTAAVKKTARKGAAKAHKVGETMTAVGQAVQACCRYGRIVDRREEAFEERLVRDGVATT